MARLRYGKYGQSKTTLVTDIAMDKSIIIAISDNAGETGEKSVNVSLCELLELIQELNDYVLDAMEVFEEPLEREREQTRHEGVELGL